YMDVPDTNSWGDSKSSPWGGLANLMFSRRFGAEDQFGLTGSLNWQSRPRTQTNFATVDRLYFNSAGVATTPESADWTGATTPSQFTTHNYTNKFTNWGGTGRFEYKPTDRLYASLFAFAYFSDEQETRNTNRLFSFDQPQNLTETTGSVRVKSADTQWRYNTFERDQRGLQGNVKLAVGERGEASANLGYSYARFLSDRPFVSFLYKPNTRVSYDLSNWRNPVVVDNAAAYLNPANYLLSTTYRDLRHAVEHVWDGRVDYSFNAKKDDLGFGFALGADYRNLDLRRDITSTNYKTGTLRMTGYALDPASFSAPGYFQPALWIDPDAFWNSAAVPGLFDAGASADASGVGDYRYQEDIYAAYANAVYSTEHLDLQGGLRLDHVSFDATMASVKNGVLQATPATKSNKDTHLLPSVTAVYSFTPQIRLKAAVSQTLGRPNPETIATVEDVDATDFTIVRGNPDIKPRRATNFDLGGEYYFNQGKGMVT
ncbi:TonB-dependent receptor, partial [bacterium]